MVRVKFYLERLKNYVDIKYAILFALDENFLLLNSSITVKITSDHYSECDRDMKIPLV
jgi:hypothetical protein